MIRIALCVGASFLGGEPGDVLIPAIDDSMHLLAWLQEEPEGPPEEGGPPPGARRGDRGPEGGRRPGDGPGDRGPRDGRRPPRDRGDGPPRGHVEREGDRWIIRGVDIVMNAEEGQESPPFDLSGGPIKLKLDSGQEIELVPVPPPPRPDQNRAGGPPREGRRGPGGEGFGPPPGGPGGPPAGEGPPASSVFPIITSSGPPAGEGPPPGPPPGAGDRPPHDGPPNDEYGPLGPPEGRRGPPEARGFGYRNLPPNGVEKTLMPWLAIHPDEPDEKFIELAHEQMATDRQVQELRGKYRQATSEEEKENIRTEVTNIVGHQFEIRQQMRTRAIDRVKGELAKVEEGIQRREAERPALIQKRVAEVLGEQSVGF